MGFWSRFARGELRLTRVPDLRGHHHLLGLARRAHYRMVLFIFVPPEPRAAVVGHRRDAS